MNFKKNLKNIMIVGILLIAVSGVSAACSPGITSQNEVDQPTPEAVTVQDTEIPATEVVQVGEGTPSGESESSSSSCANSPNWIGEHRPRYRQSRFGRDTANRSICVLVKYLPEHGAHRAWARSGIFR